MNSFWGFPWTLIHFFSLVKFFSLSHERPPTVSKNVSKRICRGKQLSATKAACRTIIVEVLATEDQDRHICDTKFRRKMLTCLQTDAYNSKLAKTMDAGKLYSLLSVNRHVSWRLRAASPSHFYYKGLCDEARLYMHFM